ncbi:hypothetical protein G436_1173 [Leptospira interrogans serovar Hardjo str. Norma]|uniref:Uncharacterized protein n=1 Tax=Leptospira interrogans serovar Hardjo str. Norma TaxID=1279460 RepID=A0A0M4NWK7_LEPIR|nr:hypothetical protein G436_1173 [Leptospira interrogans serovar Hardjo str. Norma]
MNVFYSLDLLMIQWVLWVGTTPKFRKCGNSYKSRDLTVGL